MWRLSARREVGIGIDDGMCRYIYICDGVWVARRTSFSFIWTKIFRKIRFGLFSLQNVMGIFLYPYIKKIYILWCPEMEHFVVVYIRFWCLICSIFFSHVCAECDSNKFRSMIMIFFITFLLFLDNLS